ncbi:hypothetical protein EG347_15480 [Chryseobacterium sp. G0186]|uniref:hypothetical protein n=1 Tax=Chryseobacterium sp. G0186 TaxID=2487064 RepID=UPI000F516645|nr:hypothetical protein [Chryseobacterium sp. G0186]AZA78808.1 hypothetical protein EG347_15480 [Chryseobacterium sp. G0186]
MKYFGFIKEHDDYSISKSIHEFITDEAPVNPYRDHVLEYLQNGVMAIPLMGCVEDAKDSLFGTDDYKDDGFIAYYTCYTDGGWIWPQYIIEYLKKYPHIKIDPAFVHHIIKNQNPKTNISEDDCLRIEKEFYSQFWSRT